MIEWYGIGALSSDFSKKLGNSTQTRYNNVKNMLRFGYAYPNYGSGPKEGKAR